MPAGHIPLQSTAELQARLEAERAMRPFVLYRDSEGVQRIVTVGTVRSAVVVGRASDQDISLQWDAEVSRVHALFERVGGSWTIVDDGLSRNGTFVNATRVVGRRRLQDGDLIRCGSVSMEFHDPTAGVGVETRRAAATTDARVSPAQRRVLVALCRPLRESPYGVPATNKQIASELIVSVDTVKSQLRRLGELLGVGAMPQNQKRMQLAWSAMNAGLVTPRDIVSAPEQRGS